MPLRDFLAVQEVGVAASPAVFRMNPTIPMACIVGPDKAPLKVQSRVQIEVPIHYWVSPAEETAAIIRCMAYMAEGFPQGALNVDALNRAFWTKLRHNLKAFIMNPALRGRFFIPERTVVLWAEQLPLDRILCLGPLGKAGTLLAQRNRSGFVLPLQNGVTAVKLYNA